MSRWPSLPGEIAREARVALRRLVSTPLFSAIAVASLAIGIAVTSAMYAIVASMLWQSPGIAHLDRLAVATLIDPATRRISDGHVISAADFEDIRAATAGLVDVAATSFVMQPVASETTGFTARGEAITGNYFSVLDVTAHLGRLLSSDDDRDGASPVVVLSHQTWRREFASDPGIVGRVIRIGGVPFTVVGVTNQSFRGFTVDLSVGEWFLPGIFVTRAGALTFSKTTGPSGSLARDARTLTVFARVADAAAVTRFSATLESFGKHLDAAFPAAPARPADRGLPPQRHWSATTLQARADQVHSGALQMGSVIVGMVGLVLAVACTNLANLVLARSASRRSELAVRRALGATRARLVREQVVESALVAVAGGGAALLLTRWFVVWLTGTALRIGAAKTLVLTPRVDSSVVVMTAIFLAGALVVFGLLPALKSTRRVGAITLGGDVAAGAPPWNERRAHLAWQTGISTIFFLAAAFCGRALLGAWLHNPGVDLDRLTVGQLFLGSDEAHGRQVIEALERSGRNEPALAQLAIVSGAPFGTGLTPIAEVEATESRAAADRHVKDRALSMSATPSLFSTLGVPIIQGRGFDARDTAGSVPVVVLSRRTAERLFGVSDVIGRTVLVRDVLADRAPDRLTVVGVVANTDTGTLGSEAMGAVYRPLVQHYTTGLMVIGRTAGGSTDLTATLRQLVHRVDPDMALEDVGPASHVLTGAFPALRVLSLVAAVLATVSLLLAMTGLYGLLSHAVSSRTREIGLRLALGADARGISRLIVRDGLRPVLWGVGTSVAIGSLVRIAWQSQSNTPLSVLDLLALLSAALPMLLAGLLAGYFPARRAAHMEPNIALRDL